MSNKWRSITDADNPDNRLACYYEEVSSCPICHFSISPIAVGGCYVHESKDKICTAYILMLCPHCREVFLAKYPAELNVPQIVTKGVPTLSPCKAQVHELPEPIRKMSPMFVDTFNQSAVAEAEDLTEIAGCGYRKSLEYLVKDYLFHKSPDQRDDIQSEFLGKAIQRIEDPRVKTLAERAVWIGNDETHYLKKHEALDIDDMKRFIAAMLSYIEAELSFEAALAIDPK